MLAQYWPQAQENPATPGDAKLAALVNGLPKIVVTSRPDAPLDWRPASTVGADLTAEIAELKRRPGKPLVLFAGASTAREFLRRELVDEIRLLIFPVLLGAGEPLFTDGTRRNLRFVESRAFPTSGVVLQSYR
ncbi:dihydrofolate reductase family protein [Nocardia wallacei]|uniref:dihydrofolate reductase family protein n=1 Tax=Nocardia wallacei TaxID=480035 RepID=UPI00313B02D5